MTYTLSTGVNSRATHGTLSNIYHGTSYNAIVFLMASNPQKNPQFISPPVEAGDFLRIRLNFFNLESGLVVLSLKNFRAWAYPCPFFYSALCCSRDRRQA